MRHKSHMDEDQLEKLLRQMPTIKDERDPNQIYREVQMGLNKRPRQFRVMPAIALAAAVLIFAIIAPLFLQNMTSQNSSMDDSAEESMDTGIRSNSDMDDSADGDGMAGIQSEDSAKEGTLEESDEIVINEYATLDMSPTFVVANANKETNNIVTIGVTASDAMSDDTGFTFPISIVVPKTGEETYVAALERIRYEISYPELGIEHPTLNQGAMISEVTDSSGNPMPSIEVNEWYYGLASLQESILYDQISETFRWHYPSYQFTRNGSSKNVQIGNDVKNAPIEVQKLTTKAYYKYKAREETPTFLVPSLEEYDTIQKALEAMNTRPEQYPESKIEPSIPPTIEIENVQTDGDGSTLVTIILSPTSILENTEETIFALEAMMMTAKEFGYEQVIFESSESGMVGNIQLNEPVNVPFSPNPISYLE